MPIASHPTPGMNRAFSAKVVTVVSILGQPDLISRAILEIAVGLDRGFGPV